MKNRRYDSISGLRSFSAIGIVLMHVLTNGNYRVSGILFDRLIPSFTDLVFLFMMISSFSMCCGYYDKIMNCKITPVEFYSKRLRKVWPFFALLTVMDLVISPSMEAVYEGFANLTLCFGLLPNANISVIGVGWTLGMIFVFYMLFPFFCYLISDKKRAWFSFCIALVFHYLCNVYFFDAAHVAEGYTYRSNIVYCAVYFLAGGLVFLYRTELGSIARKYGWCVLICLAALVIMALFRGHSTPAMLAMYSLALVYTIGRETDEGLLNNKLTRFLSDISLEIYLCHMVMYRILEKLLCDAVFQGGALHYFFVCMLTILGAVLISVCVRWSIAKVEQLCKIQTRT